jgi:hypothetical protein
MKRLDAIALAVLVGCTPASSDEGTDSSSSEVSATDPTPTSSSNGSGNPEPSTSTPMPDPDSSTTVPDGSSSSTDGGTLETGSSSTTEAGGIEACEPFAQECPDGLKCMPYADDGGGIWNANGCFPVVDEPDELGAPCEVTGLPTSGIDTCDLGLVCWGADDNGNGTCVAQCEGSAVAPECGGDTACQISNGGVLTLCVSGCDPLAQNCGDGQGCYPTGPEFSCAPVGDPGVQGEACAFINTCAPGLACIGGDVVAGCADPGCCSAFCDISNPADPCADLGGGMACVAWFADGMAPMGLEDVGICAAI